jgi:ATP-dependent Zn protease
MTKEIKKYQVNERHQLIDLNKDHTNFKLKFDCEAVDPSIIFNMFVTNQQELDSNDMSSLPLKKVNGKISGNIVADNNIYHNYYLILNAPQDCEIIVTIELEPIDGISSPIQNENTISPDQSPSNPQPSSTSPKWYQNISQIIFWVFIIILILIAFYLFFFSSKTTTTKTTNNPATKSNSIIDDLNNNL